MGSSVLLPTQGQPTTGPDTNFGTQARPNFVTFNWEKVGPPSPLYLQRDDTIGCTMISSIAGESAAFAFRVLLAPGVRGGQPDAKTPAQPLLTPESSNIIEPFAANIPSAGVRALSSQTLSGVEGYLLSAAANVALATQRGQTFIRATVTRPTGLQQVLFADYATPRNALTFPGGRVTQFTEGTGFVHSFIQAAPAAGADFSVTVPANTRWRVMAVFASLTASATVANRTVIFNITDGANTIFDVVSQVTQTASQAISYSASAGVTSVTTAVNNVVQMSWPSDVRLEGGFTINSSTGGLQVGDQWSTIRILVEEWLDGF